MQNIQCATSHLVHAIVTAHGIFTPTETSLSLTTIVPLFSPSLQKCMYLDSVIVFIPGPRGKEGGHYICIKLINECWMMYDDQFVYKIPFPDLALNIYLAFYRSGSTLYQNRVPYIDQVPYLEIDIEALRTRFKPPPLPSTDYYTLDSSTGSIKPLKPKPRRIRKTTPKKKPPPAPQRREGIFVADKGTTDFAVKSQLRPSLIETHPATGTKSKKKESDSDYVPSQDSQADTETTEEDVGKTTIAEIREKGCHYQ